MKRQKEKKSCIIVNVFMKPEGNIVYINHDQRRIQLECSKEVFMMYYSNKSDKFLREVLKLEELVETDLETVISGPADVARLLANRKAFDKWVNRMQGRLGFSIARIVEGSY